MSDNNLTPEDIANVVRALRNQGQLDEDGIIVSVSRQAVDTVADIIESQARKIAELEALAKLDQDANGQLEAKIVELEQRYLQIQSDELRRESREAPQTERPYDAVRCALRHADHAVGEDFDALAFRILAEEIRRIAIPPTAARRCTNCNKELSKIWSFSVCDKCLESSQPPSNVHPVAWMKALYSPGTPDEPPQYDYDFSSGEDAPEGNGWTPLYSEQRALVETSQPHLCIKPACPGDCAGCNHALSPEKVREYALLWALQLACGPAVEPAKDRIAADTGPLTVAALVAAETTNIHFPDIRKMVKECGNCDNEMACTNQHGICSRHDGRPYSETSSVRPIWEQIAELSKQVSDEDWQRLTDSRAPFVPSAENSLKREKIKRGFGCDVSTLLYIHEITGISLEMLIGLKLLSKGKTGDAK